MVMSLTLDRAQQIIERAQVKAEEIGVPMTTAVVDEGGNLVALSRMDGATLISIDVAQGKAYTACATRKSTEELGRNAQPGCPAFGVHVASERRIVIFGGGLPLMQGEQCIGGVGVSGGTVEQDVLVVRSALGEVAGDGA